MGTRSSDRKFVEYDAPKVPFKLVADKADCYETSYVEGNGQNQANFPN